MNNQINGQIIKINSNLILVLIENNQVITCKLKGILKYKNDNPICRPLVGDYVQVTFINNEFIINKIYKRKNYLIRPSIANIDTIIIVQSTKEPDFNFNLIMKFLAYYETFINEVIIIISKMDLINSDDENHQINFYKKIFTNQKYKIFCLPNENELLELKNFLSNKTFCFVGNSGVGKSTIINSIIPNIKLKTQEISYSLNRGKHTTTSSQIIINNNYKLIDTPGFSSFDIKLINKNQLANSYKAFYEFSNNCKFSNCLHLNEQNCAIKKAVIEKKIDKFFYDEYLKILKIIN